MTPCCQHEIRSRLVIAVSRELSHLYGNLGFFFFYHTAPTEIYTLSLHDALPIYVTARPLHPGEHRRVLPVVPVEPRSEEHTSELQSLTNLVCRLLLEKKNNTNKQRADARLAAGCLRWCLGYDK